MSEVDTRDFWDARSNRRGPTPEQEFEDILERTRYISREAFAFNRDAAFRKKPYLSGKAFLGSSPEKPLPKG